MAVNGRERPLGKCCGNIGLRFRAAEGRDRRSGAVLYGDAPSDDAPRGVREDAVDHGSQQGDAVGDDFREPARSVRLEYVSTGSAEHGHLQPGRGQFKVAGSCVLRTFKDKLVLSVPQEDDINRIKSKYADANIEILAKTGKRLSDQIQDSGSFRFGLVNIGADSYEDLELKFEDCLGMLPYSFDSTDDFPDGIRDDAEDADPFEVAARAI